MKSTGWSSRGWRRAGNKETDKAYTKNWMGKGREKGESGGDEKMKANYGAWYGVFGV